MPDSAGTASPTFDSSSNRCRSSSAAIARAPLASEGKRRATARTRVVELSRFPSRRTPPLRKDDSPMATSADRRTLRRRRRRNARNREWRRRTVMRSRPSASASGDGGRNVGSAPPSVHRHGPTWSRTPRVRRSVRPASAACGIRRSSRRKPKPYQERCALSAPAFARLLCATGLAGGVLLLAHCRSRRRQLSERSRPSDAAVRRRDSAGVVTVSPRWPHDLDRMRGRLVHPPRGATTPSCCIKPRSSRSDQCSTILPPVMR